MNRAVFFDRDGVLNRDCGYLYRCEDFVWLEGAPEAVAWLNQRGWLVLVVTNQSGVARGYYGEEQVRQLHSWMNDQLSRYGGRVDDFFYCPHLPGAPVSRYDLDCDCRKPRPGMIERACAKWDVDRGRSLLIGDKDSDVEAAQRAGIRGVKYVGGNLWRLVERLVNHGG
ncbi:MAG: HAD family hydrolase [Negativicutes bacterium]|nr:HAD family hydrolase [Negativicutes bacterium]